MAPEYTGDPGNNFTPDNLEQRVADAQVYGNFDEARWRRAGADDAEVAQLRSAHEAKSPEERAVEGKRLASISDHDIAAELDVIRSSGGDPSQSPYNGTIKEVEKEVGDDPDKAREALAFERSGFGKGRTSLIAHLEKVAAEAETDSGAGDADGDPADDGNLPQGTADVQQQGLAQGDVPSGSGSTA